MGFLSGFEHFVRDNEPLAPHTWLRIGGAAEYFAEPTCLDELVALIQRCKEENEPVRLLGDGSNVLVRDAGVPGVVIRLSAPAFCEVVVKDRLLTAGGGAKLAHVISTSIREGLAGLELLAGIPGSVGGALRGNAGTQSGDIGQWTRSAVVITRAGEILTHQREDLRFAYRQSSLDELVILRAEFELEEDDPAALTKRMQKLWIVRKSRQPMGPQGLGWVFKNPVGADAASLIEQAGLKGTRVGGVLVSDRYANIILADSNASSQDAIRLIELIESRVAEQFGVELERDLEIW